MLLVFQHVREVRVCVWSSGASPVNGVSVVTSTVDLESGKLQCGQDSQDHGSVLVLFCLSVPCIDSITSSIMYIMLV